MTRIVAGAARGRRLAVPPGRATRPTSDRAREGLFSTLSSMVGAFAGLRFADLYAGSGAVGLEALSRGAAHVLLVEEEPRAVAAVRANVAALGLEGAVVVAADVARLVGAAPPSAPYDVVFLDPPYSMPGTRVAEVLAALARHGWLGEGAVVVLERATRDGEPDWPAGTGAVRSRRYGEATLWYLRASEGVRPAPSPGTGPS